MSAKRLVVMSALSAGALVVGAVALPMATATPSQSCGTPTAVISAVSVGGGQYKVKAAGTEYCAQDATGQTGQWTGTLRVDSVHNYDIFSDPTVAYTTQTKQHGGSVAVSWSTGPSTCDNTTTADYYARSKFISFNLTRTKESGNKNITTC